MNGKTFDILNNIISTKKSTDDLLNQKILESENSFELFECNFPGDTYEIKNNNINLESIIINNKMQNIREEKDNKLNVKEKDDYINGGIIINDIIEYKKIIKNKKNKNNCNDNKNSGYNKIKKIIDEINKGCIQIKRKENNNDLKIYNKRNINNNNNNNKKAVNSNSMDFINVHKNKELYAKFALSHTKSQKKNKRNKNKKNNIHNNSVDYNLNKNAFNDNYYLNINNRFNIYQKLFEMKMENMEKFRLNSKNEKSNNALNNILTSSPIRLFTLGKKDLFSGDEIIKHKNGSNKQIYSKNKSNTNSINNSNIDININPNKLYKEFLDDEVSSLKSKKTPKGQSQISLSSFMSNNSSERFLHIYERFKEMHQKQKEKLEMLKKVKEDNENKLCSFNPKINQKSRKIKGNLYSRQRKNYEEQKQKYEKLKMELKKRKEEKLLLENNSKNKINKKLKVNKLNIRQKSINELLKNKHDDKPKNSNKKILYYKDHNLNPNNYKLSYIEKTLEEYREKNNSLIKKEKQKNINNISSPIFSQKLKFTNKFDNKDEELYLEKKEKQRINNKRINNNISLKNKNNLINNNEYKQKLRTSLQKKKKLNNKSTEYFIKSQEKINRQKLYYNKFSKNNTNNVVTNNGKNFKKYKTNNLYKKYLNEKF